jgi:hypothetical protein
VYFLGPYHFLGYFSIWVYRKMNDELEAGKASRLVITSIAGIFFVHGRRICLFLCDLGYMLGDGISCRSRSDLGF